MNAAEYVETVGSRLATLNLDEVEVYLKEGRTRRFEIGPQGRLSLDHRERGWAVRASGPRSSLLASGTGLPSAKGPWPVPDGYPLKLPRQQEATPWKEPPDLQAPLLVESEALDILRACERELSRELQGVRLLRAVLDDGASESEIANSLGLAARSRSRSATLYLEAAGPDDSSMEVADLFAEREGRRFNPRTLARRIADRIVVRRDGKAVGRDRAPLLLAPAVAARVVEGLLPLLVGPQAPALARALLDRQGRLASPAVTVVDDASLPQGLFVSGVDGEGVPTREVVLIEEGLVRRRLCGWWEQPEAARPAGCVRRPSWRDAPRVGPSHLFIRPDRTVAAASLLGAVTRGYYFIEVLDGLAFDHREDRFRIPVSGFSIRAGRAVEPVARAVIAGRVSALLHGIQAVARDLTFVSARGMLGSPTLLVKGVELDAGAE